jgi:hypothetical protein
MSTVGVMIGVGKAVEVAVAGNQIIVGVMVAVSGRRVLVGKIMVVGAAVQALHKITNKQKYKMIFIHASKINHVDRCKFLPYSINNWGINPKGVVQLLGSF